MRNRTTGKTWTVLLLAVEESQACPRAGGRVLVGEAYLAAWVIARLVSLDAAREALFYVAPVGEKDEYLDRALGHVSAFLPSSVA